MNQLNKALASLAIAVVVTVACITNPSTGEEEVNWNAVRGSLEIASAELHDLSLLYPEKLQDIEEVNKLVDAFIVATLAAQEDDILDAATVLLAETEKYLGPEVDEDVRFTIAILRAAVNIAVLNGAE